MIVEDKIVKVQIWDTAGQERYRSITNAYYRGAEAIIIVFDLTSKESFNHIQGWIEEIGKYTGPSVYKIILGNKSDDELNRKVSKEDILEFEKKYEMKVIEVSAKLASNVDHAFRHIVESLINKSIMKPEVNGKQLKVDLSKNSSKKCGC